MTREEILAMNPGRELDALVAEKVMGQTGFDFDDTHWYCSTCKAWVHPAQVTFHEVHERCQTPVVSDWCDEEGNVMPFYSTDISAAWEALEEMQTKGIHICVMPFADSYQALPHKESGEVMEEFITHGMTAPEAICKCALLAVTE